MENPVVASTNIRAENKNHLLRLRITKDAEKGLLVYAQSDVDFRLLRSPNNNKTKLANIQCFYPYTTERLEGLRAYFYPCKDQYCFTYGDYPNLMILLAEDLKNGVTFEMGLFPISQENIDSWVNQLKEEVKILYHLYLKPTDVNVEISTSVIEKEILT